MAEFNNSAVEIKSEFIIDTPDTDYDDDTKLGNTAISIWNCINALLVLLILGGNILTIIAVRTCRRLRAFKSNLFILSLAFSDLIVGLMLPYHIAFYMAGSNFDKSYNLCLIRFFFIIFACCVSILTLISIAVDRYIAIMYALHYRRFMTRRVAACIISFNWLVGGFVAALTIIWNDWTTENRCEFDEILPNWYIAGLITPGFVIIWGFMLLIYWRILREASKHARQLRNATHCTNLSSDWKSIHIVVINMGCFTICWLPFFIVVCAQMFDLCESTSYFYKVAFTMAMANSCLNPIIYCWKNSNFRKAFAQLLHCKNPNVCERNLELSLSHCSLQMNENKKTHNGNNMMVIQIQKVTTSPPSPPPQQQQQQQHSCCVKVKDCAGIEKHSENCNYTKMLTNSKDPTTYDIEPMNDPDANSAIESTCEACVTFGKILRKSSKIKGHVIQKILSDELITYMDCK